MSRAITKSPKGTNNCIGRDSYCRSTLKLSGSNSGQTPQMAIAVATSASSNLKFFLVKFCQPKHKTPSMKSQTKLQPIVHEGLNSMDLRLRLNPPKLSGQSGWRTPSSAITAAKSKRVMGSEEHTPELQSRPYL